MCEDKVQVIKEWPIPKNVKEVQSFLDFANFYHRFICNYSRIAILLTTLTQKNQVFQWTHQANKAFEELKARF